MVVPETTFARLTEVVAKFTHTKRLTSFPLDGFGLLPPDKFENPSHPLHDVVFMPRIIDENATRMMNRDRIFGARSYHEWGKAVEIGANKIRSRPSNAALEEHL